MVEPLPVEDSLATDIGCSQEDPKRDWEFMAKSTDGYYREVGGRNRPSIRRIPKINL